MGDFMILKKLRKSKSAVSNILSTILIVALMVTSTALTYSVLIPTIDRGRLNATLSTSALFLTKFDGALQTLMYDGIGSTRNLEVDAFSGSLDFRTQGLNVRFFIDSGLFLPIPGLSYGVARFTIPSDIAIMDRSAVDYIKGNAYFPLAISDEGSSDPAMLVMTRPSNDEYRMELWYRLFLHVKDTGVGGDIDLSIVVVEFAASESVRSLNEGTYSLMLNKTSLELNPSKYGFVSGNPIITSGDDFYMTINKNTGPQIAFSSLGTRTSVSINLIVITLGIQVISLF